MSAGERPRVVVLGSGYAGAECAKVLQSKLGNKIELVIVDKRKANVHKVAGTRAAVLGRRYCERVLIPNDKIIRNGKGEMINADIVQVSEQGVKLSNQVLQFDYLICATGAINYSVCEPPLHLTERSDMIEFYASVHDIILKASSILIVGGGPTGLELAGEIIYEYKDKKVSIVHSRETLMNNVTPKVSKQFERRVRNKLIKGGVNMVMGERLSVDFSVHQNRPFIYSPNATYTTSGGTSIQADLVLLCSGKSVSNSIYPQSWLDERGQIKVRRTLQLENHDKIYAVGDVNDVKENKLAVVSGFQADKCAANIALQIANKKKLKNYKPGFGLGKTFIFITQGRKKGTGFLGVQSVGDKAVSIAKGKSYFSKRYWATWGYKSVPDEVGGPSQGGKASADEPYQAEKSDLARFF